MTEADARPALPAAPAGRSLLATAWRRLARNRAAVAALGTLAVIATACVVGPLVSPYRIDQVFWDRIGFDNAPSAAHWFGNDPNGRDLMVRVLFGGQISLMVGLTATLVALVIGVGYGATAGFLGGRVDSVMMRTVDILYSLPFTFFVILLMVYFGRNIILIFVAIGAVEWLDMARIVRGQTLSIKRRDFIEAARAAGATTGAIIRRHVIPNSLGPVIVYMTLTVPRVILLESFLSFLGLGVQEPMTSWGGLIAEGAREMETAPWLLVWPAAFLSTTLFALNFLGDGIRDALDPRDR